MDEGENMNVRDSTSSSLPDFVDLHHRFKQLGNGPKAELRRVASLDDVASIPAYYRWLGGRPPSRGLECVAFLMPFAEHHAEAESIGQQLAKANISEMRLFQMLRAEPPRDIEHLRRLLRHLHEPSLNWQDFGRTLFYWRPISKRSILQAYFTTASN
jgi:CRISPR system Cascade subunit CasB